MVATPWDTVTGQAEAVRQLQSSVDAPVHAYLFLGPNGAGKRECAKIFAAALLSKNFTSDSDRTLRLVATGELADFTFIEPQGRSLLMSDAQSVLQSVSRPPLEKHLKVILVDRFHTASSEVAASLLKTIEEPPENVVLILLSEDLPEGHATIASRCLTVHFAPLGIQDIYESLVQAKCEKNIAWEVAHASQGSLRRANLLVGDTDFTKRLKLWQDAPQRCGRTGYDAACLADDVQTSLEEMENQFEETSGKKTNSSTTGVAEINSAGADGADTGTGGATPTDKTGDKKAVEERRKRELRHARERELRWGFSVLARTYREHGVTSNSQADTDPTNYRRLEYALRLLGETQDEMARNPNETLMLQNLFRQLPRLSQV